MPSTITAGTLVVELTTTLSLNNETFNTSNKLTITNIDQADKRILSIPSASEVEIVNFSTGVGAGTFVGANVKYLQIVNKDSANFVRIRVAKTAGETFDIKLEAGKAFVLGNNKESVSETEAAFVSFVDIDSISAQADTADVDIEYFIAST
jgi:hypothetical protein